MEGCPGIGVRYRHAVVPYDPAVVSYWREVAVGDPDAHSYRVRIRPVGVHDLVPGSLGLVISLVEWVAHAILHRRKWLIEVLDPQMPGSRNPVWAKGGYSTAQEARTARDSLVREIAQGNWKPRLWDKGDL